MCWERFQEEEKVLLGQNKTMTNLVTEWQKMLSASQPRMNEIIEGRIHFRQPTGRNDFHYAN